MNTPIGSTTMDIDFANLEADCELVICTRNTEYRFVVIDPATRFGLLSGGAFERPQEAVLACLTDGDDRDDTAIQPTQPSSGSRALFHLFVDGKVTSLMTSPISEIRAPRA